MEPENYIKRVLEEHLEALDAYVLLDEQTAMNNIQGVHNKAVHLLCKIYRNARKHCFYFFSFRDPTLLATFSRVIYLATYSFWDSNITDL